MTHSLIHQMEVGPMQNYIYFIGNPDTKELFVVDPAWDVDFLRNEAQRLGYTITGVLLTHGHPDHVNGLPELLRTHTIPVYISKHEADFYKPKAGTLVEIEDGQILHLGNIQIESILTPGHTPGSQCFLVQGSLISGDTLFIDACGRTDLPGGNPEELHNSLNRLAKLPDSTIIYPGHNYNIKPTDTLGNQKHTNPFMKCETLEKFLRFR